MTEPALELREVTVRYEAGGDPTVAGVSFAVAAAERVALVGLNGSGKTTLLMAPVGLVAHEGEILVGGVTLTRRTQSQIRNRIGFLFNVPEDQLLMPRVIDDAAFGLRRRGQSASAASAGAMLLLEALGVAHLAEAPVHHLSHGQKQRVALAGALVAQPPLLLLDEPSAGLDPPGKHALVGFLGGLDAALVVATHDLDFAAGLCTRFIMLERGQVAYDGADATEVLRRWDLGGLARALPQPLARGRGR